MNDLNLTTPDSVFRDGLTFDAIRSGAPAVFAPTPHVRTSPKYTFIPTERVLTGLLDAGFTAVDARQTHSRKASPLHARHAIRLRRRFESVEVGDAVPEILLLNSHDGSSAYELRLGLFRAVCRNGMIVSAQTYSAFRVPHRGDVVEGVVTAALEVSRSFGSLACKVVRMRARCLDLEEQRSFASRSLEIRYPDAAQATMRADELLLARRPEDQGNDLWSVFNRCQEGLIQGGLARRSFAGRLIRTRRLTSIVSDVRVNTQLWALAEEVLAE